MSSHRLDVSGQRGLSLTMNDPASTAAQTTAKPGDDVRLQLGSFREIRLVLSPGARIQRRRYTTKRQRLDENNRPVKDESGFVYDLDSSEMIVLVIAGSAAIFGRSSFLEPPAEGQPTYEMTPHTSVYAKRLGEEPDFTESGELVEEQTLGEVLGVDA